MHAREGFILNVMELLHGIDKIKDLILCNPSCGGMVIFLSLLTALAWMLLTDVGGQAQTINMKHQ